MSLNFKYKELNIATKQIRVDRWKSGFMQSNYVPWVTMWVRVCICVLGVCVYMQHSATNSAHFADFTSMGCSRDLFRKSWEYYGSGHDIRRTCKVTRGAWEMKRAATRIAECERSLILISEGLAWGVRRDKTWWMFSVTLAVDAAR